MKKSNHGFTSLLLIALLLLINTSSNAKDTINATQTITDGETLISSGGSFEFGFFSPGNSKNRYVGIWYNKITAFTVVWVANRDYPLTNTSGVLLKIIEPGIFALLNASNAFIWSSNASRVAQIPIAQLLDSGNLVVREANDENPDNYLWQSFDYPTDTLLPGMRFGKNLVTGQETYLTAWKTNDDPGTSEFTHHRDPTGYPQTFLKRGSVVVYRTGPWNGIWYSGLPVLRENPFYIFESVFEKNWSYYHYEVHNNVISRFTLNQSGVVQRWTWVDQTKGWVNYLTAPIDNCDTYDQCGAYGSCSVISSPICGCLEKFIPRLPQQWQSVDWSNGCVRRTPLDCQTDGFIKYSDVKLPDTTHSRYNVSMTLEECKEVCQKDCSCMAYTNLDIRNGGSGCLLWFDDLIDIKVVYGAGQDIYIRMASSELHYDVADSRRKNRGIIIASLTSVMGIILVGMSFILCVCKRKHICVKLRKGERHKQSHDKDLELPTFDLSTISRATNNFALKNRLGQGGFGPVYQGTLKDGPEIAVKRLSTTSMQGLDEFKNEVILIAKLQHRNLVKLLGCCIEGGETMLVYEYMRHRSLDFMLFDQIKGSLLDWPKRYQIIIGIARGLVYLHQDSRLRIIHRDLKVSNILLDNNMNAKISDFGLARSFGGNETEAKTSRVVGTYGYMSPEYATDGLFSVKSDAFSFGVMVLEFLVAKETGHFPMMIITTTFGTCMVTL